MVFTQTFTWWLPSWEIFANRTDGFRSRPAWLAGHRHRCLGSKRRRSFWTAYHTSSFESLPERVKRYRYQSCPSGRVDRAGSFTTENLREHGSFSRSNKKRAFPSRRRVSFKRKFKWHLERLNSSVKLYAVGDVLLLAVEACERSLALGTVHDARWGTWSARRSSRSLALGQASPSAPWSTRPRWACIEYLKEPVVR